ncbi:PAS domain-containing sensor histidine kinase [Yersinia wautersii]|uniref:Sensor histidine kinase ZraS n=1 Tax=Yersinia wautersii TaxID=1341643 RepID=A0ABM9TCY4_9GAMM|nr:PAS domain-containing sensor histidine kinase [Yersinia wautersii]CRG49531.1 Sensor protein of zinc sigma-54-dependenttwo-component system [Yersinia wautersii]
MKESKGKSNLFSVIPYGFFVGLVIILITVIITMAIKDLNRGRNIEFQTLLEKSAVLIRSFESSSRTGMGMSWRQRQTLMEEMAYQPGVIYIAVTDLSGKILAHSNPARVGTQLYSPQEMEDLNVQLAEQWRIAAFLDEDNKSQDAFEVYRFFKPLRRNNTHQSHMNMARRSNVTATQDNNDKYENQSVIFTAFDTEALDAMQAKDIRNTIIFLSILSMLALAGILALFWARRYQLSRRQLQDSKAISTEIINNLPIGLITTNEEQLVSVVNHTAEKIFGISKDILTGQNIHQALPPEWNLLVKKSQRHQPVIEYEIDYKLKEGLIIPLSISVANIVNHNGSFLGNIFIFRDLREVRQLQEEIRRKEKLAAIGNLAAGVAHEIRNPLSSIKGFAKYFEGHSPQGSEEQELAKVMIKEVDRLNRAVTELLGLVRPSDLRIQLVNINEIIAHSLHLIRQDADSKKITIQFINNENLPRVEIDPDRFTQALLNLYLNAIQAMGRAGTLEIALALVEESKLRISVIDTGKGIRAEDLENIFNPYFTTKASGTGLGLAIVQKVIEEHQGRITVTSHPQSGTRFDMTIPLVQRGQYRPDGQEQKASNNDNT